MIGKEYVLTDKLRGSFPEEFGHAQIGIIDLFCGVECYKKWVNFVSFSAFRLADGWN